MAKKITFKVALFGVLGAGALAYAYLRRPRYLYDGQVQSCEGTTDNPDMDCRGLYMIRGDRSGKVYAPFDGIVHTAGSSGAKQSMVIRSTTSPISFAIEMEGGAPVTPAGTKIKSGDLIAQAERIKVKAFRMEGDIEAPVAPSTWLIANAFVPASAKGAQWCEDTHQLVVPYCGDTSFRAPALPKWSLRTVRMSFS